MTKDGIARRFRFVRGSCQRSFILASAGFSILLGSVVMVAWHVRATPIIQIVPDSPPIRYNTALAILFSGLALLALARGWRRSAILPSTVVALIGGLTLSQYVFSVDFGIDQLLMQDYLTNRLWDVGHAPPYAFTESIQQFFIRVERPLPGRPSPNTSLGFTFVGMALLSLNGVRGNHHAATHWSQWETFMVAIAATLSMGVIGIGGVALLGYLTELSTVYTWRYLTGVSIPTAIGLLTLGLGLLNTALCDRFGDRLPQWFPLSVGFGVFTASLFIWQALVSWSRNLITQLAYFADEVEALLIPVANIVLLGGMLLTLLVVSVFYFSQRVQAQSDILKHLNDDLVKTNALFHATLESTADGIVMLDAERQVLHSNARFGTILQIPSAVQEAVRSGDSEQGFQFILSQMKDPEAFITATQRMMSDLESNTFDIFELKDGRIVERYAHPYWLGDRSLGKVLSYRDVTKREQAANALRESEERYRSVITAMAEGIILQDVHGIIHACNASAEKILGLSLDQLVGHTSIDPRWQSIREDGSPFPGDQHPAMVSLRTGEPCRNVVMGIHKPTGDLTWVSINSQPLFHLGESMPYAVVASFSDITERKYLADALFREKELAQVTLESIGDAVITTDATGIIEHLNPIAQVLTGWSQADAAGLPLTTVFHILHEQTREPAPNPVEQALREDRIVELERDTVLLARDGREVAIDDSAAPIRDRSGQVVGAVMVFHDVTQTRHLSRQVLWQASHDALTGLVNRREFDQRLQQALFSAQIQGLSHALCYLDLDQFKIVNDTCGHAAGDELLRQVTALLQQQVRKTDTLARLGGDEFGVLLTQCPLEQAIGIANNLRESIQTFRFAWQDNTFTIGVSIGLVVINSESEGLAKLLMAADTACYAAKNGGRNRVHIFQPNDQALVQQQGEMRWATRITQALEENRFCLYSQQIVATSPTEPHQNYCEVLIRLRDEAGNLVSPMAFMPAAERYNLMHRIDRWVIAALFSHWSATQSIAIQNGDCNPMTPQPTIYAINLSGASINDDQFLDFLHTQFAQYPIPPHLICFEITETVAIANLTKASQVIRSLQQIGCRFALDDFGSGMSSFAYLKTLPVDYLKIDGGFVKNIVEDPVDAAMVEAITRIGHVMGLKTVAEWVENDAILERVTALGVDYAQGYGIAKPHPMTINLSQVALKSYE